MAVERLGMVQWENLGCCSFTCATLLLWKAYSWDFFIMGRESDWVKKHFSSEFIKYKKRNIKKRTRVTLTWKKSPNYAERKNKVVTLPPQTLLMHS